MKVNVYFLTLIVLLISACSREESSPSPARTFPSTSANSNSTPAASSIEIRNRDATISDQIEKRLVGTGLRDVEVETRDGRVFLSGFVDSEEQKLLAERIAGTVSGVIGLENKITVCKRPPVNINKPGGPRRNCS